MNLYQLRYFTKLARLQHYTKAAEELNITQPNLTHAIHSLEEELGVPLFEKMGRGVILTKYGREFLDYARRSLSVLDDGIAKMRQIAEGKELIRLGFLRTLGTHYIPDLLTAFGQTESGREVSFSCLNGITPELIKILKDRQCDLIFTSREEGHPDLEFIPVLARPLYLIVPKDHPLAGQDEVTLSETLSYPYILFRPGTGMRSFTDQLFAQHDFAPHCLMEIEEDEVIAGFVAKNFGISLMHDMDILDSLPVKRLNLKGIREKKTYYMGILKECAYSPAIQNFIRFAAGGA